MGTEAVGHTPGPLSHYPHGNNGASWGIDDENGREIALVRTNKADAQGMAAWPDLLAALRDAQDIVQQHNLLSDGPEHSRPDLHRDRIATLERLFAWLNGPRIDAIARAEGGAA